MSFFLESVLLSAIGGIIGCLLVLPLNNVATDIGNSNFAQTQFYFHTSPQVMAGGIIFAIFLGVAGGLFPARMAAKKEILTALREV